MKNTDFQAATASAARCAQRERLALRVLHVLADDGDFQPLDGHRAFELADEMLAKRDELHAAPEEMAS